MVKEKNNFNVPDIPKAPTGGRALGLAVDYDYLERKKKLSHRLPFFTKAELVKRSHPYHILLMHEMMIEGHFHAVQEVTNFLREEERELRKANTKKRLTGPSKRSIVENKKKILEIINALKTCHAEVKAGRHELPTKIRMTMGESFLKEGELWLAEYFLLSGLESVTNMEEGSARDRMEAEINCILAFITRENHSEKLETALEEAIKHLVICRTLAKDQTWQVKPHLISIRLKKPIALHGLRNEYVTIEGNSMSMYLMATLLEHEMLIGLANEILHPHSHFHHPLPEDLAQAHLFADNALKLAHEIRHPIALSSAMIRFGIVLIHNKEYQDALVYFKNLVHHAEICGDQESYAIAQHNIAKCFMGLRKPVEAITCLLKQREVAEVFQMEDLEADALQELGMLLLQEGQVWEAEESYACAYEGFVRADLEHNAPRNHSDYNFAMWGISAGLKLWSRFAGLCRRDAIEDLSALVEWKTGRLSLPEVPHPNYDVENAEDTLAALYNPDLFTEGAIFPDPDFYEMRSTSRMQIASERLRPVGSYKSISSDSSSGVTEADDPDDHEGFFSDYERHHYTFGEIRTRHQSHVQIGKSMASAMDMRGSLAFPVV